MLPPLFVNARKYFICPLLSRHDVCLTLQDIFSFYLNLILGCAHVVSGLGWKGESGPCTGAWMLLMGKAVNRQLHIVQTVEIVVRPLILILTVNSFSDVLIGRRNE